MKRPCDFFILEESHEQNKYEDDVTAMFHAMDIDKSESVTAQEMRNALKDPHIKAYLRYLHLDVSQLLQIFDHLWRLGSSKGRCESVRVQELVACAYDFRGTSTRIQVRDVEMMLRSIIDWTENQYSAKVIARKSSWASG